MPALPAATTALVTGACAVHIQRLTEGSAGAWGDVTLCGGHGDEIMPGGTVPSDGGRPTFWAYLSRVGGKVSRKLMGTRVAPAPEVPPLLVNQLKGGSTADGSLRACNIHYKLYQNAPPVAAAAALTQPGAAATDADADGDHAAADDDGGASLIAEPTGTVIGRRFFTWAQLAVRRVRTAASSFTIFRPRTRTLDEVRGRGYRVRPPADAALAQRPGSVTMTPAAASAVRAAAPVNDETLPLPSMSLNREDFDTRLSVRGRIEVPEPGSQLASGVEFDVRDAPFRAILSVPAALHAAINWRCSSRCESSDRREPHTVTCTRTGKLIVQCISCGNTVAFNLTPDPAEMAARAVSSGTHWESQRRLMSSLGVMPPFGRTTYFESIRMAAPHIFTVFNMLLARNRRAYARALKLERARLEADGFSADEILVSLNETFTVQADGGYELGRGSRRCSRVPRRAVSRAAARGYGSAAAVGFRAGSDEREQGLDDGVAPRPANRDARPRRRDVVEKLAGAARRHRIAAVCAGWQRAARRARAALGRHAPRLRKKRRGRGG